MSVSKIIELVGEDAESWEEATKAVITEAQKSLRGITRIRIEEFDVRLGDNQEIQCFRVRAKVAFRIER